MTDAPPAGITPQQVALVRASFHEVQPVAEQFAAIFYARLFVIAPGLRALFKGDMEHQGRELMNMLTAVVNGLDRFPDIAAPVRGLGRRHHAYGATAEDYRHVGMAMLDSFASILGERFTPEAHAAWSAAYRLLAATMLARPEASAAKP